MSNILGLGLTAEDIVFAAMLAFVITWGIHSFKKIFKIVVLKPTEFNYGLNDTSLILNKCYQLFPRDMLTFRGQVFKRGMIIRVTTIGKQTFEGKMIGLNNENVLCLITSRQVVAHEVKSIEDIAMIKDSEGQNGV